MSSKSDPIKHVVLLMLENHSFDEMLGCFQSLYPDLDGVGAGQPRYNLTPKGDKIVQSPKQNYCMPFDPRHETEHVLDQVKEGNSGFVADFAKAYPNSKKQDYEYLMGYYPMGFLPALHGLARDFTICDRWFSSLPGPTWPNRYFALSGTSSGYVQMPEGLDNTHLDTLKAQTQTTLFDRLSEKGRTWKIYYYDFPNSLSFANQRKPENLRNYYDIDQFFNADSHNAASFPDFAFIEPKYFGIDQNDDHPPHNVMKAEKLVADVYNAIRSNAELWNSTLLVVVFDEHGGFYDHVTPPAAIPPDDKKQEYDFTQLGVRVPALLISPWVGRRVHHTQYDHTSLLRYLSDKWQLGPLGARTAQANSIADAITEAAARTDTIGFIRVPFSELIKSDGSIAAQQTASGHQSALYVLAEYIRHEMDGIDSPLFADSVTLGARISRAGIDSAAWLGRGIQWLGNSLAMLGERAQAAQINRATSVAANLIRRAKITRN